MRAVRLLVGLLTAGLAGLLAVLRPAPLPALDWLVYDALVRSESVTGGPAGPTLTAVVAIDEASLARYGQWPWSRESRRRPGRSAPRASGATTIAFDVLFAEPDRQEPGGRRPARRRLGAIAQRARPRAPVRCRGRASWLSPASGRARRAPARRRCRRTPGSSRCVAPSARCQSWPRAAGATGFINATPDVDGRLRRMPLLVRQGDDVYPSPGPGGGPARDRRRAAGARRAGRRLDGAHRRQRYRRARRLGPHAGAPPPRRADARRRSAPPTSWTDAWTHHSSGAASSSSAPRRLGLRDVVTTPIEQGLPGVVLHAAVADTLDGRARVRTTGAGAARRSVVGVGRRVARSAPSPGGSAWSPAWSSGLLLAGATWWAARGLLVQSGRVLSPSWAGLASRPRSSSTARSVSCASGAGPIASGGGAAMPSASSSRR